MSVEERVLGIPTETGTVTGLLHRPDRAVVLLVLAHGAGAGIRHGFFEAIVPLLGDRGVGTLRFQFPYMESGRRRPDPASVAERVVRDAVVAAEECAGGLPVLAGGKSFGGRMTSQAHAARPLPGVRGIVFLGFPLQAARAPGTRRAAHLLSVFVPMLFVQGSRDRLAPLDTLTPIVTSLGGRATLHVVDGGDHSFAVPKTTGRAAGHVMAEIADVVAGWGRAIVGAGRA